MPWEYSFICEFYLEFMDPIRTRWGILYYMLIIPYRRFDNLNKLTKDTPYPSCEYYGVSECCYHFGREMTILQWSLATVSQNTVEPHHDMV